MREIDIAFLYEHVARELDVACAITANLRRSGLSVEIIQWPTDFPKAVLQFRPRLVVLPFCYKENSYESMLAYWRNSIFFNMTWEQLNANMPSGLFATQHVIYHAWSDIYKELLIEKQISSERIFLNGHPAYSLYDEPYRHYYPSRAELAERYGLDASRRWILFPESYSWAFYSEATLEQIVESGISWDDVIANREFCNQSLEIVLKWCAKVARDGVELILRPRPSTTQKEFEAFAKRVLSHIPERLHIIQEESVREWILASDIVVSSHSTSLIEAAVAKKDVYILEPIPIPTSLYDDWHDLLPHLKSEQEFTNMCFSELAKEYNQLSQWARQTLMGQGDSIRNLISFLESLARGHIATPPIPPREIATPTLNFIPPAWLWSLYRRLKQWLRYRTSGGIEPGYVKDVVSPHTIENIISRWDKLLTESEV